MKLTSSQTLKISASELECQLMTDTPPHPIQWTDKSIGVFVVVVVVSFTAYFPFIQIYIYIYIFIDLKPMSIT